MNVESLDWEALERLRARFLSGEPVRRAYWRSAAELAAYDATFGERIGWKWDAALRQAAARGWAPPAGAVFDFGCGSGVAGRRVLAAGRGRLGPLWVHDLSPLAEQFAADRARETHPGLEVRRGEPPEGLESFTLVVSHVLNELDAAGRRRLTAWVRRAAAVLWVEPGARLEARQLAEWRDRILAEGRFAAVAPCPHGGPCGLRTEANERHWCHHFADPPAGLAMDGDWARFARRAGIDIGTAPYSYLVLGLKEGMRLAAGGDRIIGGVRRQKGQVRFLSCGEAGVRELRMQARTDEGLTEWLAETGEIPLMAWSLEGGEVTGGGLLRESGG